MSDFDTHIFRRPDGSIATSHYIDCGRIARAEQARRLFTGRAPEHPRQRPPRRARFSVF